MMGPLREALIRAAKEGLLAPPDHVPTDDEFAAWLAQQFPDSTPEELARVREERRRMLDKLEDFGV